MSFPRIDHPEFAEFIRRFYGISKPEAVAQRQPSQDRQDATHPDAGHSVHGEMAAGRRGLPRIGLEVNQN